MGVNANASTLLVEEVPAQNEPVDQTVAQQPSFTWPSSGSVRPSTGGRRGIEISGGPGSPIFASAPGRVVYKGTGVKGYGEFIIIKHDNGYLSAYGNTSQAMVNEGDPVSSGQMIGRTGESLHFEIRKDGAPLDPLQYLPKR